MAQNLIRTILSRRSVRKYVDKQISNEDVKTILEAAMAAPSASNRKPWHFIIVTERERLNGLAEAHPYGKMLHEAPLCISVCGDTTIPNIGFKTALLPRKMSSWQRQRLVLGQSGWALIRKRSVLRQ